MSYDWHKVKKLREAPNGTLISGPSDDCPAILKVFFWEYGRQIDWYVVGPKDKVCEEVQTVGRHGESKVYWTKSPSDAYERWDKLLEKKGTVVGMVERMFEELERDDPENTKVYVEEEEEAVDHAL
jgi:hypothetical protein